MLIAETDDGHYEPVAVVASIDEAREIAASDLRGRMRDRAGETPACPVSYKVWARGMEGNYRE